MFGATKEFEMCTLHSNCIDPFHIYMDIKFHERASKFLAYVGFFLNLPPFSFLLQNAKYPPPMETKLDAS